MLTQVQYMDEHDRPVPWRLGKYKGLAFEQYLFDVVKHDLRSYFPRGLRIVKTTNSRDDGLDIQIQSSVDFTLFGIPFYCGTKASITVTIECKTSDRTQIVLEKFIKNVFVNRKEKPDYFILVTNAGISPYSYYIATDAAEEAQMRFFLVDQRILAAYLESQRAMIGGYSPKRADSQPPLAISYQICKSRIGGKNCFELYLLVRNYSPRSTICSLQLLTDRNWSFDDPQLDMAIEPYHGVCRKLLVIKEYNDGIDDFALKISFDGQYKIIKISNTGVNYDFEPPLSGEAHKRLIQEIAEALMESDGTIVYHISGEAGIGKTRIIDEVCKRLSGTDYKISTVYFQSAPIRASLPAALAKGLEIEVSGWDEFIRSLEKNRFERYCFILEDIHNAGRDSVAEIKTMLAQLGRCAQPVAVLLASRDDDTVYNEEYFSFAEWLKLRENAGIRNRRVAPLKDEECVAFIRSMILDLPDPVLERITQMSQNTPYYIVQFIEYLLEIDLAKLLNRNTVGITNVKTFCQRLYIPEKIEELLRLREGNLLRRERGAKYQEFLQIIALFGITAPKEAVFAYWGAEDSAMAEELFRIRFLRLADDGGIRFDHETMYLFYAEKLKDVRNMRRISARIAKDFPAILDMLPPLQQGKLFFHAKQYAKAADAFRPIIEAAQGTSNISSVNIPAEYFPYLEEAYELSGINGDTSLQKKLLIGSVYVSIHNRDYGTICRTLDHAFRRIETEHPDDARLFTTISELRAHAVMNTADLCQARKYFQELLAQERLSPEDFAEESRFDLFDRAASLFTRYNHRAVAQRYNQLATKVAEDLGDKKLIALSTMMRAKILFYSDTGTARSLMEEARGLFREDMAYRTHCHNNASILSASFLLSDHSAGEMASMLRDGKRLLEEASDQNYSFTVIRCNLTLATLYYYMAEAGNPYLDLAKKHIAAGINVSIRYGCEKLMNYFYNLKAVISIYEKEDMDVTRRYFETMLRFLRQQDLLFLGNLDFCYGNIVSLTNYVKFMLDAGGENQLYRLMGSIRHYKSPGASGGDTAESASSISAEQKIIRYYMEEYDKVKNGALLFVDSKYSYPVTDPKTGYYLVIH